MPKFTLKLLIILCGLQVSAFAKEIEYQECYVTYTMGTEYERYVIPPTTELFCEDKADLFPIFNSAGDELSFHQISLALLNRGYNFSKYTKGPGNGDEVYNFVKRKKSP